MGSCLSRCWCSCCAFDVVRRIVFQSNAPNVRLYQFKSSTESFDATTSHYSYCRKLSDNSSSNIASTDQRQGIASFTDDVSCIEPSLNDSSREACDTSIKSTGKNHKSSLNDYVNGKNHSSFARGIKFWALTNSFKKCRLGKTRHKYKQSEYCCQHSPCSVDHQQSNENFLHSASGNLSSSTNHQMCHCTCDTPDSRSSSIVSLCDNRSPRCHSRNKLYPFKCMQDKKSHVQSKILHDRQLDTVSSPPIHSRTGGQMTTSFGPTSDQSFREIRADDKITSGSITNNMSHNNCGYVSGEDTAPISIINVPPPSFTMIKYLPSFSSHSRQSHHPLQCDSHLDDDLIDRGSKSESVKRKQLNVNSDKTLSESSNSLHNSLSHYCNLLRKPFNSSTSTYEDTSFAKKHAHESSVPCRTMHPCNGATKYNDGKHKALEITEANKIQRETGSKLQVDTLSRVVASGEGTHSVNTCNTLRNGTAPHPRANMRDSGDNLREVKRISSSSSSSSSSTSFVRERRGELNHSHGSTRCTGKQVENDVDEDVTSRTEASALTSSMSSRFSSRMLALLRTNDPADDKCADKISSSSINKCDGENNACQSCYSSNRSSEIAYASSNINQSTFRSRLSSLLTVKSLVLDSKSSEETSSRSSKCNFTRKTNAPFPSSSGRLASGRRLIEESSFTQQPTVHSGSEYEYLIYDFDIPEPTDGVLELQSPESLSNPSSTLDHYKNDHSSHMHHPQAHESQCINRSPNTLTNGPSGNYRSNWVQFHENIARGKMANARESETLNSRQGFQRDESINKGAREKQKERNRGLSTESRTLHEGAGFNGYVEDCMKFRLPCNDKSNSLGTIDADTFTNSFNSSVSSTFSMEQCKENKYHRNEGETQCKCSSSKSMHPCQRQGKLVNVDCKGDEKVEGCNLFSLAPSVSLLPVDCNSKETRGKSKKINRNSFPLMDPLLSQDLDETYALAVTARKRTKQAIMQSVSTNVICLNNPGYGENVITMANDRQINDGDSPPRDSTLANNLIDTCDCNLLVTNCPHKSSSFSVQVENNSGTVKMDESPSKSSIKSCDDSTINRTQGGDVSPIASVDTFDLEWDDYDQKNVQPEEEGKVAQIES